MPTEFIAFMNCVLITRPSKIAYLCPMIIVNSKHFNKDVIPIYNYLTVIITLPKLLVPKLNSFLKPPIQFDNEFPLFNLCNL